MHLGPRTRADNEAQGGGLVSGAMPIGYYVITPFKLEDGSVILVNRGWIPRQLEGESRRADQIEGVVTIEGVLRNGEEARIGLPANRPGEAPWIWLDVAGMSKHSGADPIFIEMMSDSDINRGSATGDYPATRRLFTNFSNNHLSYAITWYGLCIFSTVVLWRSQRRHTMVHGLRR
ncbi:Surfeit locus protein 1 [Gaertneriomyces sp. JEL0708]|nr:Surfeit locus protein 1 [Gaertneriomyces sp. JEL0708]